MAPTPPKRPATSSPRVWVLNPARAGFFGWLFRYYSYAFLLLTLVVAAAPASPEPTDPGSVADFEAFCRNTGHALLEQSHDDEVYRFVIKKSA